MIDLSRVLILASTIAVVVVIISIAYAMLPSKPSRPTIASRITERCVKAGYTSGDDLRICKQILLNRYVNRNR